MDETYKEVHPHMVLDEIEDGHDVLMLDKKAACVLHVSAMVVEDLVKAVKCKTKGRFSFWYREEVEEDEPI